MKNYRYIAQGEYYITTDEETVLVTSGMTECIAIAFIDKTNPNKRMLSHLDGMILYDNATALSNIIKLKESFIEKTDSKDFEIHILGGQKKFRNYRILLPIIESLELKITNCVDINEFRDKLNVGRSKFNYFTTLDITATFICQPTLLPDFISYNRNYFSPPITEDDLIQGKGLLSKIEQEKYNQFVQINDNVLSTDLMSAKILRTSADQEWLDTHQVLLSSSNLVNNWQEIF